MESIEKITCEVLRILNEILEIKVQQSFLIELVKK